MSTEDSKLCRRLRIRLRGETPARVLAGKIALGLELGYQKRRGGYAGPGSWQQYRSESIAGERPTWEAFCLAEAGVSEKTANTWIACGGKARQWLKRRRRHDLLALMDGRPDRLKAADRKRLIDGLADMLQGTTITGFLGLREKKVPNRQAASKKALARTAEDPPAVKELLGMIRRVMREELRKGRKS
jgi:hypothetical protein